MTSSIFHIHLNITNNYVTQYHILKSDIRVGGWKIQKKDKWLAITFSVTNAAGIRLYMNTCKMLDLIFKPFHVRESVSGIGNWVTRRRENGESDGWLFFKFYGIYL